MIDKRTYIDELKAEREIARGIKDVEKGLDDVLKTVGGIQRALDRIKSGENPEYDFIMSALVVITDRQGSTTKTELADLLVGYRRVLGDNVWRHGQTKSIERIEHLVRRREIHASFMKGGKIMLEPIREMLEKYSLKDAGLLEENFEKAAEPIKKVIKEKPLVKIESASEAVEEIIKNTHKDKNAVDAIVDELIRDNE